MGTDTFTNYFVANGNFGTVNKNANGTYTVTSLQTGTDTLNGTVSPGSVALQVTNTTGIVVTSSTVTAVGDGAGFIVYSQTTAGLTSYYVASSSPIAAGQVFSANASFGSFNPACFLRGTRIGTPDGETEIELLERGDLVVTAWGESRRVAWVGVRSYGGRFLKANPRLLPIRFSAGSLGQGLPRRDLYVSPKHAMLIDGFLVRAELLVGQDGIERVREASTIEYLHIELDTHDAVLAEGAPSETFLDDDSRAVFHNAYEREGVPSNGLGFCAPHLEDGPELERIRRRLRMVAAAAA